MSYPNLSFEKKLHDRGFRFVAGIDEVGRGAFAGPVMVGAVIFPQEITGGLKGLNDSKLLKSRERLRLSIEIKKRALSWSVASVEAKTIDHLGIGQATQKAMRKAVGLLKNKGQAPDFLLVDAFYISYLAGLKKNRQWPIKKGDRRSSSIAAASILAKVTRDRLMGSLSRKSKYRFYGWGRNKGYGTLKHRQAIRKHGPTRLHRKDFIRGLLRD